MTTWVLIWVIVVSGTTTPAITTGNAEFNSRQACIVAGTQIPQSRNVDVVWSCSPK